MVQILQAKPKKESGSADAFMQAFATGLEGYSQAQQKQKLHEQMQKENEFAQKNLGIDLSGVSDPERRKLIIGETLKGKIAQDKARFEETEMQKKRVQLYNQLIENGMDEKRAALYVNLTTGGQTEFAKSLMEMQNREPGELGNKQTNAFDKINPPENQFQTQPTDINQFDQEDLPELPKKQKEFDIQSLIDEAIEKQNKGILPKEIASAQNARYSAGLKSYEENQTKYKSIKDEKNLIGILDDLQKSKKLPKILGQVNVDKEGNLRFPYGANAETQRYVKTLNEFSKSAKDSYGSRVTNFDLQQFMKRFPTLLNNEEGRKQILQQMRIVNEINETYYKNLHDIISKAGGIRKIDMDVAQSLAEKVSEPKVDKLSKKFKEIGEFTSKPSASEFPNKRIRDSKTGEIFESNGSEWIKVE